MPRILVIDDDAKLTRLLTEYLQPEGFRVESVTEGATGIERAISGKYEIVVLDVMLPGINGFEVLRRIRAAVESQKYAVRTGRTVEIGISVGISCFPADGETTEELLTAAARNMQQDKHARKLVPSLSAVPSAASMDNYT